MTANPRSYPLAGRSHFVALRVITLIVWLAPAAAIAQEQPLQQPQQQAEQAMQGGGMTDERTLADETARGHFRLGTSLYDQGNFRQAAEEFAEAYRLSQRPQLMFNAYVAYRDANDLEHAVDALRIYLEGAGDTVEDRVNLEARLRSMSETLDEQRRRDAALAAEQERNNRPPPPPARGPEVWPWVILGVGAAIVVGGAITGGLALAEADALAADCPESECGSEVDFDGRMSTIDTLGIVTDVLLFGGGAIAITGLILGIVIGSSGGEPEVQAGCSADGCRASMRARF
jgi:tetratricopeptide (TPR) repeat protein